MLYTILKTTISVIFVLIIGGCDLSNDSIKNSNDNDSTRDNGPSPLKPTGTVADADGNVYQTVKIGDQEWTIENLRVTKYNDGKPIPLVTGHEAWRDADENDRPAYCYYDNSTDSIHIKKYGALYNWHVINSGKLAPSGWHVPTDAEWTELEAYLITNGYNWDGMTTGNKIAKSLASKTDWSSSNTEGGIGYDPGKNNASGFSALPGGFRSFNGDFDKIDSSGYWWGTTMDVITNYPWFRLLYSDYYYLVKLFYSEGAGLSVRLLRD